MHPTHFAQNPTIFYVTQNNIEKEPHADMIISTQTNDFYDGFYPTILLTETLIDATQFAKYHFDNKNIDALILSSSTEIITAAHDLGIKSIVTKKYRHYGKTSVSDEGVNLLDQDFTTTNIHEKWVADITYIYTKYHGWTYLASVEDLHTRKIVGSAMSKTIDKFLVIEALDQAYYRQRPKPGVIFHSDRGTQYTAEDFKRRLNDYGMIQSLSNKGNPYDNACIESFHSIIKKEYVHHVRFKTFEEAKLGCLDFIEGWYNRNRIHGSIDYQTPHELELTIRRNL